MKLRISNKISITKTYKIRKTLIKTLDQQGEHFYTDKQS